MKLKVLFFTLIISGLLLCGCGSHLADAYDLSAADINNFTDMNEDGFKADGFASALCVSDSDTPINADGVNAAAYGLFDLETGEVVSQSGMFERVYPASTTKVLTCLIALERGDLDSEVVVPEESDITVSGSSMADLKPGDRISMRDLLYGLMVPSGNDAAVAIACHISGSVSDFTDLMNERAHEIGATNSHFVNPHGLPDENHYTTAYDMYLILNEAMKNSEFAQFASVSEYTASVTGADGTVRSVTWTNGNGFLAGNFSLPDGVSMTAGKTGHTNAAGFCLVLAEETQGGKDMISVVFNAPTYEDLYNGMRTLITKGLI